MPPISAKLRAAFLLTLLVIIVSSVVLIMALPSPALKSSHMWPNHGKDLTKISWAHAVNSQAYLTRVLKDDKIAMLEADVSLGTLVQDPPDSPAIPIMAHPPDNTSDLSLESFLNQVIEAVGQGSQKGIKLDFKTIDVVEQSLESVYRKQPPMPVWVNADILPGPGQPVAKALPAAEFINLAAKWCPGRTLSIGWTTGTSGPVADLKYTSDQVQEMLSVIRNAKVSPDTDITFPIRAAFVHASQEQLKELLKLQSHVVTLTIWSGKQDQVDGVQVADFIRSVGTAKVYLDVPEPLYEIIEEHL